MLKPGLPGGLFLTGSSAGCRGIFASFLILIMFLCGCAADPAGQVELLYFSCTDEECRPLPVPPKMVEIRGGLFTEGGIDLTGDGKQELIVLWDGSMQILHDGKELWRSPEEWLIIDAAIGDPNNDGRSDIVLALWKSVRQSEEKLTSHPFIIGYRGGYFKTIWGGSALTFGLHELELADLNGNGIQELVVIESTDPEEGRAAKYRTVSVWKWHGWGYTLQWRSEPGQYSNLHIYEDEVGSKYIGLKTIR